MKKIFCKKQDGSMGYAFSLVLILFIFLIITFSVKMRLVYVAKDSIDDGIISSCLASAVIDLNEYSNTHNIVIADFDNAYNLFYETLKTNLELDDTNTPNNSSMITSGINIDTFSIYNVVGNDIYVTSKVNGIEQTYTINNGVGSYMMPDGNVVNKTSVYSKISFEVTGITLNGFLGIHDSAKIPVSKECSVAVAKNTTG